MKLKRKVVINLIEKINGNRNLNLQVKKENYFKCYILKNRGTTKPIGDK